MSWDMVSTRSWNQTLSPARSLRIHCREPMARGGDRGNRGTHGARHPLAPSTDAGGEDHAADVY